VGVIAKALYKSKYKSISNMFVCRQGNIQNKIKTCEKE
jgi:hypothetical protein